MYAARIDGIVTTMLAVGITAILSQPIQAQSKKFVCQESKSNVPTTYADTPEGPKPVMRFASTYFPPPYTPMRRCQEVTERYNQFHEQGILEYMTSGWVNKLPVICAGQSCSEDTVLLTLKPDQEPDQALQQILANRSGASGPTVQSSGSGSVTISLQNYLDQTPVENPKDSGAEAAEVQSDSETEAMQSNPESEINESGGGIY